jgi:hypothetical protein
MPDNEWLALAVTIAIVVLVFAPFWVFALWVVS